MTDLLTRHRDSLGYFWRALATIPLGMIVYQIKNEPLTLEFWIHATILILFLARFSVGNFNYTAALFSDGAYGLGSINTAEAVRWRFRHDAILYSLHLGAMIAMSIEIDNPDAFRRAFLMLLLSDLYLWTYDRNSWPVHLILLSNVLKAFQADPDAAVVSFPRNWLQFYTPRIWVVNNACAGLAIVAFEIVNANASFEPRTTAITLLVIAVVNSVVDFARTNLDM